MPALPDLPTLQSPLTGRALVHHQLADHPTPTSPPALSTLTTPSYPTTLLPRRFPKVPLLLTLPTLTVTLALLLLLLPPALALRMLPVTKHLPLLSCRPPLEAPPSAATTLLSLLLGCRLSKLLLMPCRTAVLTPPSLLTLPGPVSKAGNVTKADADGQNLSVVNELH